MPRRSMALAAAVVPSRRRLRRSPHGPGGRSITVWYQDSILMLKNRHTARQNACRAPGTPSRGCSIHDPIRARTNPNGRLPGSQIYDVRRGFATKPSKACKHLVYLVVHPSLVHFITLKYASTLHKRRPCDARTNAPPHAHTRHRRAARSHVCRHVCKYMQAPEMSPSRKAGDRTAQKCGIARKRSRGRRIAGPAPFAAPPAESLRGRQRG